MRSRKATPYCTSSRRSSNCAKRSPRMACEILWRASAAQVQPQYSDVSKGKQPMAEIDFSVSNHVPPVRLTRPDALHDIHPAMDGLLFDAWRPIHAAPQLWCPVHYDNARNSLFIRSP